MIVIKPGPDGMSTGTVVEVDGVAIPCVQRIELVFEPREPIKAVIEVLMPAAGALAILPSGVTVIAVEPDKPIIPQPQPVL